MAKPLQFIALAWVAAITTIAAVAACIAQTAPVAADAVHFRPPAVPLITFDPYMSIWSEGSHLANHQTHYWDGRAQNLISLVRVDGKTFRLMGKFPTSAPALPQTRLRVLPTRTVYLFANSAISLKLTFLTPRLPGHVNAFMQPVTYVTWTVRSADGRPHKVQLYFSASAAIAVNHDLQQVTFRVERMGALTALKCGSAVQDYFDIQGDPVGLDWGHLYTAARRGQAKGVIASTQTCLQQFVRTGGVPRQTSSPRPQPVNKSNPLTEAFAMNLGTVGGRPVRRHVLVAYDEGYAINYFGEYLRPFWRKAQGMNAVAMLQTAEKRYGALEALARKFDRRVMADATRAGGKHYARIAALAYRQSLAAMGMAADRNGQPLIFTKEETSNGDIATVDVLFPASPIFLLFNPQLEAASMAPVLVSADTPRWKYAWSPHDLGTYPVCTGHYRSGGENMPVEESGNMIILADAIAQAEGNANFAARYWPLFTRWANYLRKFGVDPGKQLSTDDFLGFRAHNANLSVKAIEAVGAYGQLCAMRGLKGPAAQYTAAAHRWARKWMKADQNGAYYRAAFNQPNQWSELYNMAWNRVLGLHLFPRKVTHEQMAWYMTRMTKFGLPLNSTRNFGDTDHSVYTAMLAHNGAHFRAIIGGLYTFLNDTPTRVPLADFYNVKTGAGYMHARPVVGAIFVKMMANRRMWHYWVARGLAGDNRAHIANNWAPLPPPPVVKMVVPTAQSKPIMWRYTIHQPKAGWTKRGFADPTWQRGPAGFGTFDAGAPIRTRWTTSDIWLRRHFTMPPGKFPHLCVYTYHDEDIQVYINGVLAARATGYSTAYVPLRITRAGRKALHAGKNLFAYHVHQTTGGQFADIGLAQWWLPRIK